VKVLKYDSEKCTGCLSCQLACSFQRLQLYNPEKAALKIKPSYGINNPSAIYCRHCVNPPCLKACEFGAMKMVNGVVEINKEKCTSCGLCIEKCPFNAIFLEEENVYKCDQCKGKFNCAQVCITGAITAIERKGEE